MKGKHNERSWQQRLSRYGYEIGLLVILFIGGSAYQSARNYFQLSAWVTHTNQVLTQISALDEIIDLAMDAYSDYRQTGLETPLKTFKRQMVRQKEEAAMLLEVGSALGSATRARVFVDSMGRAFLELESIVNEWKSASKTASLQERKARLQKLPYPSDIFSPLRAQLHELEHDQRRELSIRQIRAQEAANFTFEVIGYAALLSFFVLVLARITMLRDMREIRHHETELKRAREDAEQASRSKSVFLANMSHEIRTPMNAVIGMTNALMRSDPRPDQFEAIETIRTAGRTLLRIIQGVLDLSRIEADKLILEVSDFNPQKLLREIRDIIKPSVADDVSFKMEVSSDIPLWLKGDSGRLQQVLINLLGNAAKFTDHGQITLRVAPTSQTDSEIWLRFTIIDSGVGIPASSLPKLFQPFSQVSPESSREKLGTGLGLSISKRLVEAMRGRIEVESVAGRGSTFWFELPLAIADGAPIDVALDVDSEVLDIKYEGEVLVVDDNPANRHVAKTLLECLGFTVRTASSGYEALHLTASSPFDVVFMDCQMPGLDGFETTTKLRAADKELGRYTPIVALTAHSTQEASRACYDVGMDDFLTKPIDFDQLATVVGRFVTPVPIANPPPKAATETETSAQNTATGASAASAGPVDFSILSRLRGFAPPRGEFASSSEVIDELLRLYNSSRERSLRLMREHLENGNHVKLGEEAHFFKSSSMSVGAVTVTSLLERMETCRKADALPPDAPLLFKELEEQAEIASARLQSWWLKERA